MTEVSAETIRQQNDALNALFFCVDKLINPGLVELCAAGATLQDIVDGKTSEETLAGAPAYIETVVGGIAVLIKTMQENLADLRLSIPQEPQP